MSNEKYRRLVYIVFIKKNKKINHCYVLTMFDKNRTILINQTNKGLEVQTYNDSINVISQAALKNGAGYVVCNVVKEEYLRKLRFRLIRNSVGLCKDALGLNKPFIFTPKQLFNYLSKGR